MAKQMIKTLKEWFRKGKYPTESQFHDWMDSYWHKDEKIGTEAMSPDLMTAINSKAEQAAVTAVSSAVTELTQTVENVREDMEETNWKNGEGDYSVVTGFGTTATGSSSFAGGLQSEANGDTSMAYGWKCKANGLRSTAFGLGTETSSHDEFACGEYNQTGGEDAEPEATLLFSIGNGQDDSNRRNAVEVAQDDSMRVAGIGGFDGTNTGQGMSLQERVNGSPMVHLLCAKSDNGDLGVPANKYTFLWDDTSNVTVLAQHNFPMQWREDIGMGYLVMPATGILSVDYQVCDAYSEGEVDSFIYVFKASADATEAPAAPLRMVAHFKGADYSGHFAMPVSEGEAVQLAIINSVARDLSGDNNLITWTLYEW